MKVYVSKVTFIRVVLSPSSDWLLASNASRCCWGGGEDGARSAAAAAADAAVGVF